MHLVCTLLNFQARKKSTKINFLGPETARWGGGLPREGVVVENFVPSLESLSSLGFEERNLGCPGNFAGMSRTPGGIQKVSLLTFSLLFSEDFWVSLSFPSDCSIFSTFARGHKTMRSLREERKTQTSS